MDDSQPFFIVGPPRAGTTLLRLMLGHHPAICECHEMEFVASELAGRVNPPDSEAYVELLGQDRGFRLSGYHADPKLSFEEMAVDFLRQRQALDGKLLVGATVHHHFDELPRIWPDAKFIYLLRDPRDVARSCVQMGWAGTAYHGSEQWLWANDAWLRLQPKVSPEQTLIIRFEDLIADSASIMTEVCEFLGVDFDDQMFELERNTTYKRPNPDAAAAWQDADPRDITQIEARVGRLRIEEWGYAPSNLPPIEITPLRRLTIEIMDLKNRVQFRIKRYGFSLWAAGVISRRLPLRSFRERTQAKIDAITNSYMK